MSTIVESRQEAIDRIGQLGRQLRAHGVARLALFGSFARNAHGPDSDVDVLVDFLPGQKSFDNFLAVCELLEDTLQRKVELVTTESLSPYIGPHILREAEDVLAAN